MSAQLTHQPSTLCRFYHLEDQCPCLLAQLHTCPLCSHLMGSDLCGCDWLGDCLYQNSQWKDSPPLPPPPTGSTAMVIRGFPLPTATYIMFCRVAPETGANLLPLSTVYAVIWRHPSQINIPGAVVGMYPEQVVALALCVPSPGDRYLCDHTESFQIKAVPKQAVFGLQSLAPTRNKRALIISSGFGNGLAPAVASTLHGKGYDPVALAREAHPLTVQLLKRAKANLLPHSTVNLRLTKLPLEKPHLVVSLGPESQHRQVIRWMEDTDMTAVLLFQNNAFFSELTP